MIATNLVVNELRSEDIRQEQKDFVLGIIDRRGRHIGVNSIDLLPFP